MQAGRLDFFLISENITRWVYDVIILPGYRSDHSIVSLDLKLNKVQRYKNFWKFNNSLLSDSAYTEAVKKTISDVKQQYAAMPYNPDKIDMVPNFAYQTMICEQLFFELMLHEIRKSTIKFATEKKKRLSVEWKN